MIENKLHGPSHYSSLEDLLMQVILQGNEQVKVDVDIVYDIFFSYGIWILTACSFHFDPFKHPFPFEPDSSRFQSKICFVKSIKEVSPMIHDG